MKKTLLTIAAAAFLFGGAATVTPSTAEACLKKGGQQSKVMGWQARKGGSGWMSNWREKRAERKAARAEKRAANKGNRKGLFSRMTAKKA